MIKYTEKMIELIIKLLCALLSVLCRLKIWRACRLPSIPKMIPPSPGARKTSGIHSRTRPFIDSESMGANEQENTGKMIADRQKAMLAIAYLLCLGPTISGP